MVLTFYDSLFLLKIYNKLILYDYRYYFDFLIVFNLFIIYNTGCPYSDMGTEYEHPVLEYGYPIYIPLYKLYMINESDK